MIKTFAYVGLFTVGGLIVLGVISMWTLFIVQNFREKPDGVLNWSPFMMPDFVAINNFWTTPAALFSGALGIALILISIAFHLHHVRRQEVGALQLENIQQMTEGAQHNPGA